MAVNFKQATLLRTPTGQVERDGSQALGVQAADPHRVLFIGLRRSTGTVLQGVITRILGERDGDVYFAPDSQLAEALYAFKKLNKTAECYALALDENAAGTAGTGTFPFVGTATEDKTVQLRVGSRRVYFKVLSGDSASSIATKCAAAFALLDRFMWTGAAATGTVTLTCRHKGLLANDVTFAAEVLPAGVTCVATSPTNGSTNPLMSAAIAALDEKRYDTVVTLLTDSTSMAALEAEMARRAGPSIKEPGHVIAAMPGTLGTMLAFNRNSEYSTIMGSGLSPTVPWVWAAQVAARDALTCDTQPNRPRKGLSLPDCEAPATANVLDADERDSLLRAGVSTFITDYSGACMIDRLITTYQKNSSGVSDATYLDIGTVRTTWRLYVDILQADSKFDQHLVMSDDDVLPVGIPVVTPKVMEGAIKQYARSAQQRGLVKNLKAFEAALHAEINALDTQTIDVELPFDLVQGLVGRRYKLAFKLS